MFTNNLENTKLLSDFQSSIDSLKEDAEDLKVIRERWFLIRNRKEKLYQEKVEDLKNADLNEQASYIKEVDVESFRKVFVESCTEWASVSRRLMQVEQAISLLEKSYGAALANKNLTGEQKDSSN